MPMEELVEQEEVGEQEVLEGLEERSPCLHGANSATHSGDKNKN